MTMIINFQGKEVGGGGGATSVCPYFKFLNAKYEKKAGTFFVAAVSSSKLDIQQGVFDRKGALRLNVIN